MRRDKTHVDDIQRDIYDIRDADNSAYKISQGLNEEIVREISALQEEPKWMLDLRLKSFEVFNELKMPSWGPSLSELNMDDIVTYVRPHAQKTDDWNTLPDEIRNTFDRLGIPKAEQESLSGVGAQYD